MKTSIRLVRGSRFSTTLVLAGLLALTCFSGAASGIIQAQNTLPDAELYEGARHAAASKDYVKATVLIYAYLQRGTDFVLKDDRKRQQVWDFYQSSANQLDAELHPGVRYTMSAPPSLPDRAAPPPAPAPPVRARADAPPSQPTAPAVSLGAPAYPIVCQGGGKLYFSYEPTSGVAIGPQIWIRFEHGTSVSTLAPGQCAWPDRPIALNEPSVLVFAAPVFGGQQFSISWQRGQVMGVSAELGFINALLRDGGIRTFRVYNNGQGYFIVSAIE